MALSFSRTTRVIINFLQASNTDVLPLPTYSPDCYQDYIWRWQRQRQSKYRNWLHLSSRSWPDYYSIYYASGAVPWWDVLPVAWSNSRRGPDYYSICYLTGAVPWCNVLPVKWSYSRSEPHYYSIYYVSGAVPWCNVLPVEVVIDSTDCISEILLNSLFISRLEV